MLFIYQLRFGQFASRVTLLVSEFIFLKIFIEVQLIYNVVLVSGVQHSDSVVYIFFFIFFFIMAYYRILNIVPCAIH